MKFCVENRSTKTGRSPTAKQTLFCGFKWQKYRSDDISLAFIWPQQKPTRQLNAPKPRHENIFENLHSVTSVESSIQWKRKRHNQNHILLTQKCLGIYSVMFSISSSNLWNDRRHSARIRSTVEPHPIYWLLSCCHWNCLHLPVHCDWNVIPDQWNRYCCCIQSPSLNHPNRLIRMGRVYRVIRLVKSPIVVVSLVVHTNYLHYYYLMWAFVWLMIWPMKILLVWAYQQSNAVECLMLQKKKSKQQRKKGGISIWVR